MCDVSGHRRQPNLRIRGFGCCRFRGLGVSGLVVAAGVDGQFAQQFAGGGVDDADVQVVHEHANVGSGVGSADAVLMWGVAELAGDAQGDAPGFVDLVGVD